MNLEKDNYIIVEIIPTHSKSDKGIIAQISALKLEGLNLLDRFDYRVEDKLIENEDLKNMIAYDKKVLLMWIILILLLKNLNLGPKTSLYY